MLENRSETLYVTIDTEPDCDIHWNRSSPNTFTSVTKGIPKLLRPIWNQYHITPIYFVSPEVLNNAKCCLVLKNEIRKGAIIGAHLHSEYIEPRITKSEGQASSEFPCYSCSYELEKEKISNLTQLIQVRLGVKPLWYRAARFGADLDTMHILKELGYRYDSSVTPYINWKDKGGPDHSSATAAFYEIRNHNFYSNKGRDTLGIIECPVTIVGKRFGILGKVLPDQWLFYSWLRPTHMLYWEQKKLIDRMQGRNLVMMFHSMEIMINKTPYVRNKLMQKYYLRRLEKTIAYAVKKGYQSVTNENMK